MFASFVISDLHIKENGNLFSRLPQPNKDIPFLIIAGDVGDPFQRSTIEVYEELKKRFQRILFVRGNHDVYNYRSLYEIDKQLNNLGLDLIQNNSLIIGNVEVIGTTLWTEIPIRHQNIIHYNHGYTWEIVQFLHNQDKDFLKDILEKPKEYQRIVITHFPISFDWAPNNLDHSNPICYRYYNTKLDPLLDKADVFICGHNHCFVNKIKNNSLLIENPIGYPGEITNFNPKLYLEIFQHSKPVFKSITENNWRK